MSIESISSQNETENSSFDTLESEGKKTSWTEHLKHARELIKQKVSGEKAPSEYYLLSEHVNNVEKKAWKDAIKSWDEEANINIPRQLGEMMEKYVKDPNFRFGIHRSDAVNGEKYETDEVLAGIMKNGLMNLSDASSGFFKKDPDPSKTVSFCNEMVSAIAQTKGNYKGSTGAILVAIPSEYVDKYGELLPGKENDVYNHNEDGASYIKPEFILGFVQNLGKGTTCKFIPREDFLDESE